MYKFIVFFFRINKPMSPPPSDGKQTKKEKKEKEKDNEMQQNKEKSTNKDNLSKKEKVSYLSSTKKWS